MKIAADECFQEKFSRLNRVVVILALIVSLQLFALESVLRGWQALDAKAVYSGICISAACFVVAMIVYLLHLRSEKAN